MSTTHTQTDRRDQGTAQASLTGSAVNAEGAMPRTNAPGLAQTASPSLGDGFNGASDAAHLERAAGVPPMVTPKSVWVQCTRSTKKLLHRAGHKRPRMMMPYEVRVMRDRFGRLQLAA